jgi:hypothetical protein
MHQNPRPVAFINFSTEQYVNLVALNQFELFGAAEHLRLRRC